MSDSLLVAKVEQILASKQVQGTTNLGVENLSTPGDLFGDLFVVGSAGWGLLAVPVVFIIIVLIARAISKSKNKEKVETTTAALMLNSKMTNETARVTAIDLVGTEEASIEGLKGWKKILGTAASSIIITILISIGIDPDVAMSIVSPLLLWILGQSYVDGKLAKMQE